jgi:MurNAc alpha-1-phosphate uridylyltransferase
MVLAAGFGTRMRPVTETRPKPLVEVAGRTLIDRTLDLVEGAGLARAVVNLHHLGHMIRGHLAGRARPELAFSEEAPEILDTGGGIRAALPLLGARPFLSINTDAVWTGGNPLAMLAAESLGEGVAARLLLVPREAARGHSGPGDFFLEDDRPVRRGAAGEAPYVFSGAQMIAPGAFDRTPEGAFSLNLVWDRLLAAGRVRAQVWQGGWADVGTPEGIARAEALLAEARA